MPAYTVHMRYGEDPAAPATRLAFVREGFSFWAFLLGPVWMLAHRMVVVLIAYLLIMAALLAAMAWLGLPVPAQMLVLLLVAILVGLEAPALRRFTLRRWQERGVVIAETVDEAERRFLAQEHDTAHDTSPIATRPADPPPGAPGAHITGLFPGAAR